MKPVQYRTNKPPEKGGRWVVTRIAMTDVGLIRVHGTGATAREARINADENHSAKLDRLRRRASRPVRQHPDID